MADPQGAGNKDSTSRPQMALGVVLVLAALAALGFLVSEVLPSRVSNAKNPSFVDNIFANPVVLLFTRVALMAAAVYVLVSVIALMGGRRWLAELGPFKASDPIARLDSNAELLENELQDAVNTIEDLEARLVESDESLAKAQADIGVLLDHIDTIELNKEGN